MNYEEFRLVARLHKITGKKMEVCLMCLRRSRGDYHKALEKCSTSDTVEGGR